ILFVSSRVNFFSLPEMFRTKFARTRTKLINDEQNADSITSVFIEPTAAIPLDRLFPTVSSSIIFDPDEQLSKCTTNEFKQCSIRQSSLPWTRMFPALRNTSSFNPAICFAAFVSRLALSATAVLRNSNS
ncbi:hypothetical protein quinque_000069, partial [Culex quinquefasciatus]